MAWYRTGTISLTNGSTTVTGSGTTWIANAGIGEALYAPDGRLYEIANIASDTSITLGSAYLGTTASAQPYVLVPSQSYIRDLASQAADLVNNYSTIYNTVGQGKFADGTLANPAIRFSDDLDTGFFRSATNEVTFVAGGVAQFKYNTSGLQFTGAGSLVNLTTTGNTTLGDAVADTVTINGTPTINAPTVITTSSTTDALRITQTGTGNAFVVEDSASPDSTPFVIDANGAVLAGYTANINDIFGSSQFQLRNTTGNMASLSTYSASAAGGILYLNKSRSGTNVTNTIVQSGDTIANLIFAGADGSNFVSAAQITAAVDGIPGTNDMPGRLVFSTTADGASSPTERMRIDNQGKLSMGGAAGVGQSVLLNKNITGSVNSYGVLSQPQIQSDVTSNAYTFYAGTNTASASFTLGNAIGYAANQAVVGAGSTVTNQIGFDAGSSLTGATNNFGFRSNIASGPGRYNFYAAGTADNYFAGKVGVGMVPSNQLDVSASTYCAVGVTSGAVQCQIAANASGSVDVRAVSNHALILYSNNTTRLSISSAGTISIGATAGSESLRVNPTASAVNYVSVQGSVTGGAPIISATGSDTNIGLLYSSKGVGVQSFYSNNFANLQFNIAHTASAVNYLQVTGGAAGGNAFLTAQGSDTNVNIYYGAKGSGIHYFVTGGGAGQFAVTHTASAVNYLQVTGGATNQAPSFTSVGSDTNIDLALSPKGTGNVRFGTLTANADAPITGYIEIKDSAGNIRKLAVIA